LPELPFPDIPNDLEDDERLEVLDFFSELDCLITSFELTLVLLDKDLADLLITEVLLLLVLLFVELLELELCFIDCFAISVDEVVVFEFFSVHEVE